MEGITLYVVRLAILGVMVTPVIFAGFASSGRPLPAWMTVERRRLILAALLVVGWVHLVWHMADSGVSPGHDALAYWAVDLDALYQAEYGASGLFVYSPAAALLSAPLGALPRDAFLVAWSALSLVCVVWLARRETLIWLAFPPLVWLLVIGNIEVLIGVAVVLGFRHPWAWSFILLTKVTPGVGLLWFPVRGEWRSLGIALVATVAVAALTYAFMPDAWAAWLRFLSESESSGGWLPLMPRLMAASILVVWGARTDRPWTVLVAAILSVPHFWFATLGGLVALAALGFSWSRAVSDTLAPRIPLSSSHGHRA